MTNLSKYGQNAQDKTYPDYEESVFGHMVLEIGMSPDEAVQNLRPWVRDLDRTAATSKNTAYITAFIGAGAGLATAATIGIGVTAILPIAAAVYNFFIGQQSAREQSIRNSEYLLLKSCPELLKLIYALTKRGMPKEALVECYDELLDSFTMQFQTRAALGVSEELDHDIIRSFQEIVQQKCDAENLARSIVADAQDFKFDTLYQSTEPTAPRVEAPAIGPDTKLGRGVVDVPAEQPKPASQPEPADRTPSVSEAPQPTATNQGLSKQQVIALPMPDRARYLIQLLADSGCDLRKLTGRSTLAAGGLQRSGKTTLIILLAILEKAMGQRVYYISRDNDLYPVAFDGFANGSTANAVQALMALSDRINNGSMGSLTGETWILDEFSSTAKELPDKTRDAFWSMALTGFAKQGGRVRFIVHHKTASANGIPKGESETFKAEVKMFWTDRLEIGSGDYQPSGQYELLAEVAGHYQETGEKFIIPDWLLTDTNPSWHNAPCPVRSLLAFFPELDTRRGAIAQPLNKPKANPFGEAPKVETRVAQDLERMFNLPDAETEHETEEDVAETSSSIPAIQAAFPKWKTKSVEVAASIVDWLAARSDKSFTPATIRQSIRKLKDDPNLPTERIKTALDALVKAQFLTEEEGKYSIAPSTDDYDF